MIKAHWTNSSGGLSVVFVLRGLFFQYTKLIGCPVEPRLFEPKSPLPGNGILQGRDKERRNGLRRFKDAGAETKSR